ncbi:MAG: hypothetical protein ABI772_04905 [Bacteroidota bacterium]
MKELIEKVSTEAGITPEQAQKAVESVAAYLKNKTPHVFHEQLDVIINGGTLSDGMKKKMNDLKDDFSDAARNFGQKAEELASDMGKKINEVFGKKS